jgi:ribosomal protein S18 acetylase RimI-like enzyme
MQLTRFLTSKSLYRTEKLSKAHLPEVVSVHQEAFPGFFLSALGARFLSEFYRSFVTDDLGSGFVAINDPSGQVLGFVVGPTNPIGYFGRLVRRRWWAFAFASAQAALLNPSCVPRLLRALSYRGEPPVGKPRALLSSIAVSPRAQGCGVGAALVRAWVAEVRARDATGCYLTTDACDNDAVNGFYQSLGWKLEAVYSTPEGRRMNRYVCDFDALQGGGGGGRETDQGFLTTEHTGGTGKEAVS